MAIRPDPDPKSASPRSGAPKGELEQYGVWVKAEPQDVFEEVAVPGSEDLDFDLPRDTASLPEESFLSEDEEKLLGSFDSEFEASSGSSSEESGPLPDIEDMPALDDSLLEPEPRPVMEEVDDIPSGSIDISLEDIEVSRGPSAIHPGVEIDMDSVEGLSGGAETDGAAQLGAIEDVSSDFLDLVEEPEPAETRTPDSGLDDVTSEFLGAEETASAPKAPESSIDFEPLDIDLHFDDGSASGSDDTLRPAPPEAGFEAVTDFDDFLAPDDAAPASNPQSINDGFDDVSAVERELSAPPSGTASSRTTPKPDLSTEILLKIADELSSIRGELISLKTQIGDVMKSAEPAAKRAAEAAPDEGEESGPTGGFFDDEEDETIALTGDELDNILNTADFTEEIAEAEEPLDLESEILPPESSSLESGSLLDETLLPESGDYSSVASGDPARQEAKPAIEEVRIGQADSVDEIGLESLEPETEVLSLVVEEGVKPMTPAPDDTSYLEGIDAGMELGGAPLGDEPLVEPDLSEFDLEPEELEPRPEIDEELPLASEQNSSSEELTLGIEAGPGYAAEESVVEAEFLEPVPEVEEPNFSEINLHEEGIESLSSSEPSELEEIDAFSDSGLSAAFPSEPPAPRGRDLPLDEEEDLVLEAEEETVPDLAPSRPPAGAAPPHDAPAAAKQAAEPSAGGDGDRLKSEIRSVLSYLDKLLDSLPEDKIEEFANSEYFDTYKKLFEELGLV